MLIEANDSEKIYGKTGTGTNGTTWFIGFVEKDGANTYFDVYLEDDSKEINGKNAKEVVQHILIQKLLKRHQRM